MLYTNLQQILRTAVKEVDDGRRISRRRFATASLAGFGLAPGGAGS